MPHYLAAIHHPESYDPFLGGDAMIRGIAMLKEEMKAAGAKFFAGSMESTDKATSLRKQSRVAGWSSQLAVLYVRGGPFRPRLQQSQNSVRNLLSPCPFRD